MKKKKNVHKTCICFNKIARWGQWLKVWAVISRHRSWRLSCLGSHWSEQLFSTGVQRIMQWKWKMSRGKKNLFISKSLGVKKGHGPFRCPERKFGIFDNCLLKYGVSFFLINFLYKSGNSKPFSGLFQVNYRT